MLSEKMAQTLNDQLNAELYSSYLYYSMSAYFESTNLKGIAHWFRIQTQEELAHAHKIYQFINDRNGNVNLKAVQAPPTAWGSPLAAFEEAYKHEQEVTKMIYSLMEKAVSEKDYAIQTFLQWFINEQVEEEALANDMVEKFKMIGDNRGGLFMVDRELASRSTTSTT